MYSCRFFKRDYMNFLKIYPNRFPKIDFDGFFKAGYAINFSRIFVLKLSSFLPFPLLNLSIKVICTINSLANYSFVIYTTKKFF